MKNLTKILILITLFSSNQFIVAQDDIRDDKKKLVLIKNSNGTEYIGEILSDDGREMLILTKNIGKIFIKKSNVISITETNEIEKTEIDENNEFRAEGPFTTRYYFTNNALPIKKGENYALMNLFGPEVHFSVSDKLSLGVIASWIGSPITLVSKFSVFSKNNVHFSIGNILGSSGYLAQGQIFGGLHWGTLSVGNRMKNISFSAGYGYFSDKSRILNGTLYQDALFLGMGGIAPVGKKASFIMDAMLISNKKNNPNYNQTPNYYINPNDKIVTNTTLILMPGMRFYKSYAKALQISLAGVFFKDNSLMDSSFNSPRGNTISFPVPTISWLRKF